MRALLNNQNFVFTTLLLFFATQVSFAQTYQLSGKLTDARNMQAVPNTKVKFVVSNTDTITTFTNSAGVYSYTFKVAQNSEIQISTGYICGDVSESQTVVKHSSTGSQTLDIQVCGAESNFNLEYEADVQTTDRMASFVNLSDNAFQTFMWDFGDGSYSFLRDPIHEYLSDTTTSVCLSATLNSKTYTQCNPITIHGNNTLNGKIYSGGVELENGIAFLVGSDKKDIQIKDMSIVSNGDFNLNNIKEGYYGIYAVPNFTFDFLHFPHYIPTYYGNTYRWEEMQHVNIRKNVKNFELNLLSYPFPYYGNCKIQGTFFPTDTTTIENENIYVILLNAKKEPIDFRTVENAPGFYNFPNLPFGTYYIHAEGLNRSTEDHKVVMNEENVISEIDFDYDNTNFKVRYKGSTSTLSDNLELYIYKKNIFVNSKFSNEKDYIIELYDLSGRLISQNTLSSNENTVKIDATHCVTGIYMLSFIHTSTQTRESKKVYLHD